MASVISWLDVSTDEHRRMRELAALFEQSEAREELGLASLRDDLADALFPGTSTLHTRARYATIVPWCFQVAADRGGTMDDLAKVEREVIDTLRRAKVDIPGLLGKSAGAGLKTLPSSLYWTALQRWGVLAGRMSRSDALAASKNRTRHAEDDSNAASESIWRALPVPAGFPKQLVGGLDLTAAERVWLRERIQADAPESLLAHLTRHRPNPQSSAPWLDSATQDAPDRAKSLLEHAHGFSTVMHGAQLLYNLLLAEARARLSPDEPEFARGASAFDERLLTWSNSADLARVADDWSLEATEEALRATLRSTRRTDAATAAFVHAWQDITRIGDLTDVAQRPAARTLVAERELRVKGAKARLRDPRRLMAWGGSSGASAFTYRWGTVRQLLLDIHDEPAHA